MAQRTPEPERDMLALRLEELQRERDSLNDRWQQREAELRSIQSSRMWWVWMRYQALRRAVRAVLSLVLSPRATMRSAADAVARIAGSIRVGGRFGEEQAGERPAVSETVHQEVTAPAPGEELEPAPEPEPPPFDPDALRPRVTWQTEPTAPAGRPERSVLVIGIYLANRQNNVVDIVETLAATRSFRVEQRWIALCGGPPSASVAGLTVEQRAELAPKGALINAQIDAADLTRFEYVVLCDDDVVLPTGFLDAFLGLQERLQYRIAQPARTLSSYIDLPIVEQHPGLLARQTLFVEQGPVVSIHRSAFEVVFPFDLRSPMGWGLENVWSLRASERGLKMGIIDNVPVDHSIRRPLANYSWDEANRGRSALFASTAYRPNEECFKVVDIVRLEDLE